ncbi:helicase-associated domain-containing protein [Actinokineospora bangkokensis]|uniref:DNA-binding protein n=1 Tax=Actinokineospora bangkokensis TaxID=1193682 RepID=A0A1Q9LE07_9PSEU|nr:helicase-associated domain-containing protein [Actinokineospora bangkokensis]OLR90277.1 DNA-binding protein [Actinokineospora bangkokensis]
MSGTTLTDWLRSRDDEALAAVLRARPDLATPRPADTAVLATRATTRASVARAAEGLDTFTLAVLDALLAAGADQAPVPVADLTARLGATPAQVAAAVERMRSLALAWGPDDAVALPPAAREAAGPAAALGRPKPDLDGVDVPGLLAGLPEDERKVLDALAGSRPVGRTRDAAEVLPLERARTPIQRLLARGLLTRVDAETVELPAQVGAALRGTLAGGSAVSAEEPALRTTHRKVALVDSTAGGAALELVRRTEALIRLWSAEPAPVLKSGGLGVRDVKRVAKATELPENEAVLLVEVAVAASLVADSESASSPEWVPTQHADLWLAGGPANRWSTLAAAWLDLPRLPGLGGLRDAKDKILAPLSDDLRRPIAPVERLRVLDVLAALPPGTAVTDPDDVAALLAWRAPRRGGRLRDEVVRWALAEATTLGVVALGALSGPGRVLVAEGAAAAAKRMTDALPEPVDHVLVQADLTVVAPGPLEPHLAALIDEVADVESAGSATVYRVSETSIRRALDAGRSAADLHELFKTRSKTPVPQSLEYLVDDVARRHGRLRGGSTTSFLRCDDPALIAEVLANPVAAGAQLRRIAPTVLVSPLPLLEILDDLRAAGFAPVAEGTDGEVVDLRAAGRRVQAPARALRRAVARTPGPEQLLDMVQAMRAGDRAADSRRGRAVSARPSGAAGTADTLALLQEAARAGRRVWIGLVDAHGVASQRVVAPTRVGGGILEGTDPDSDDLRRFPLHRITSAALVEEG